MKIKDIECLHYKGDGYVYKLYNGQLWLCDRCNKFLLYQMKEQEKIEKDMKEFQLKLNKQKKKKKR